MIGEPAYLIAIAARDRQKKILPPDHVTVGTCRRAPKVAIVQPIVTNIGVSAA
ncbi:hypothetical protein LCGC14_0552670 [marine sediment metagenome]|uniref:Uncharacterized protein n=1 Tax=marine sediment metagenome TaxID=412755 RepID=A0A0F9RPC1_9ZZZZ